MQQKTIIKVNYAVRKEIKEALKTSYPTVSRALNGDATTELHCKIRHVALQKGGIELKPINK